MIFATVGTQLPFDRLINALDAWAGARPDQPEVFAQVGPTDLKPAHIEFSTFLTPDEHDRRMNEATVVVGHAGMGTIIGSLQLGKPVVIMPRKAQLGEHRNDHQLATAARFAERPGVRVATDEYELASALDDLVDGKIAPGQRISPHASEELLGAVRAFIRGE